MGIYSKTVPNYMNKYVFMLTRLFHKSILLPFYDVFFFLLGREMIFRLPLELYMVDFIPLGPLVREDCELIALWLHQIFCWHLWEMFGNFIRIE